MSEPKIETTIRSNEAAAMEITQEIRRRWGFDLRSPAFLGWMSSCIGEVRAEVVEPNLPPHQVANRWSESYDG